MILNKFTGGMVMDQVDSLSSPESYTYALNAIHETRHGSNFGLTNEESDEIAASIGETIVGHSHIEEWNQTLFFTKGNGSSLWLFNHEDNSTEFVCSDQEFGCDWGFGGCEFLYGEFKSFNACNELHVYFSSDCVYRVVNINEMLDRSRKSAIKDSEDCTYFDVFKATCSPNMSALPSHNSGSTIEGGTVQFAVQFRDNDGNESNVFDVSQPVYLETEDNIAGQVSTMSAKLHITGLDKHWNDVTIYVIHTVGQTVVIRKMPTASYGDNGFTFEYYGQKGELVDISTIINKQKAWLRGQDLLQKDGRMFFYNIKNERNLNYQKYANNIEVEWVEYEVSMEQQLKYHFPSLMRGEVYALGIVWNYADGTHSPVFHIPSCGGSDASGVDNVDPGDNMNSSTPSGDQSGVDNVDNNYIDPDSSTSPGETGPVASGGQPNTTAGVDDAYNPIEISNFDTSNQFDRERNPEELEDRPHESDKLEEAIQEDISNIDTVEQDYIDASECTNCDPTHTAVQNDLPDVSNTEQNIAEILAGYGNDDPDPDVNTTDSLKEAAEKLYEDAVVNREFITRTRPGLTYSGSNQSGVGESPTEYEAIADSTLRTFTQEGVGTSYLHSPGNSQGGSIRGDNWVDSAGNSLIEDSLRVTGSGKTNVWESVVQYPDSKDCDGNYFYPQGNICHHQMPWTSERPHFTSYQNGVVNKYQPDNYEYGKTFTRPLGLRFNNIKFPDQDDLPKPLCPKSPFKIVYVKRTDQNRSVFAKGWLSGTFDGDVYGSEYKYPRHGVNSFEHVDRFISTGDGGESRMGSQSNDPVYTFHSPDTDCDNSYLPVTKCRGELALKGSGWRHGLYAEGKEPENDQWTGTRKDNRGARVSNNLNHYTKVGVESDIVGISFAPSDSIISPPSTMEKPLMNRYRESSVYIETSSNMPGDDLDESFVGDVLDHFCPTKANAPYVALYREMPDQYGSVEGLRYIDLGISATTVHANGENSIEGICGDIWIAPYSKRRTSYVSNKVGNFFNPPKKPDSPCRQRSWCDSPDDMIFEYMGINYYPTRLPISGDKWDPKNYAGLHTVSGECGPDGLSRTCSAAAATGVSESDYYFPRTLKSLVHTVVESQVNPWLRETGEGSQLEEGKVWYPKLKDLYLDADAPSQHPWEESFLTRFYCEIEQPSKKQLWLKAMVRSFINLIVPAGLLTQFQNMETGIDTISTFLVMPMLMVFWVLANNTLFNDRQLNKLLGIRDCLRDEEGGDLDETIKQFEDAYSRYNWDYSKVNDTQPYHAFPLPYNTCDCDSCDKEQTNNEIYYSNKQNLDSEIDAYRNVRMNNYNELPANAGRLQRLFLQGQGFYAHTTDGIWMLQLRQESMPNGVAFQQSGTGELLAEPQLIFEGVSEGYAGTEHPNAAINTAFGYFFIDDVARKIYRFNGSLEEVSAYGMYHFFKEKLGFCSSASCYDEKTPYGIHYALGWDPRHNRLLITKQDGSDCSSFTASYTPLGSTIQGGGSRGKWISFHSYMREAYLWDRNNFYSIDYGTGTIYKHHSKGSYQTYGGVQYPFEVQFSSVSNDLEAFNFEYLVLDTECEINTGSNAPIRNIDATFNKVAIWNSTEGTGTRPITFISDNYSQRNNQLERLKQDYSQIRFHRKRRLWEANEIKNLVRSDCYDQALVTSECECEVIQKVNESIFDCTKINSQDFKNRILSDKFLTFKYILDNRVDMRLILRLHKIFDDRKQIPPQG